MKTLLPMLLVVSLWTGPILAQEGVKGPPFYDSTRSLTKQTDAAKKAKEVVRMGISAVPDVLRLLADRSAHVRDGSYHEIVRSFGDDAFAELARNGLRNRNPKVAVTCAEAIGASKKKALYGDLERALRASDPDVRAEAAWALGELGRAESASVLLEAFHRERTKYFPRGEMLLAATRLDVEGSMAVLEEATTRSERQAGVRIVALSRLVEIDEKKGAAAALAVLSEPRRSDVWSQRLLYQALETFQTIRKRSEIAELVKSALDLLIGDDKKKGRMQQERGRAIHEIGECLRDLTGFKYPDNPKDWKQFWKLKRETFVPKDKPTEKKKKKGGRIVAGADDGESVVTYMGIPVYSDRIGFMLDLSGGMSRPLPNKKSRLTHAKDELRSTLSNLSPKILGNVVFFATKYFSFARGKLIPLRRNLRPIFAFIDKQKVPSGKNMARGNLYDPLLLLLNAPSIDTVFLISEGNPTEGLYVSKTRFMHHLTRRNRYLKVRVFSLLIGSSGKAYMEGIAEGTGGDFHDVSGTR